MVKRLFVIVRLLGIFLLLAITHSQITFTEKKHQHQNSAKRGMGINYQRSSLNRKKDLIRASPESLNGFSKDMIGSLKKQQTLIHSTIGHMERLADGKKC